MSFQKCDSINNHVLKSKGCVEKKAPPPPPPPSGSNDSLKWILGALALGGLGGLAYLLMSGGGEGKEKCKDAIPAPARGELMFFVETSIHFQITILVI